MSDVTPVHSTTVGETDATADTFRELEAARAAGTLASNRELAREGESPEDAIVRIGDFEEKSPEELAKLTKSEILDYYKKLTEHNEKLVELKVEAEARRAERAAIHGIPRGKKGEELPEMKANNPEHPGRGIPYQLKAEDGQPRVSGEQFGRPNKPVTRTDN